VHRLVAEVFIGNIGSMHINHIDRNRKNNNLENLELVTIKENNIHSAKLGARINVLTKDGLAAIKRHLKLGILTQRELSCLIGITQSTITKINQGKLKYYGLQ
jgi:predicted transcriptional regulator